jgi:hypothetical protein
LPTSRCVDGAQIIGIPLIDAHSNGRVPEDELNVYGVMLLHFIMYVVHLYIHDGLLAIGLA